MRTKKRYKSAGSSSNNASPQSDKGESRPALGRRDLLKFMTAVPAAALVSIAPATASPADDGKAAGDTSAASQAGGAYKRKILNDHEWETIRVLSDWIIPADEKSGSATAAGVPEFVDDWLDFKRGRVLDKIRGGITWLDLECNRKFQHDFIGCTKDQQKEMLDRIAYPKTAAPEDAAGVAFFNEMRDLVVSGFFSSKMGVADLPYLGNKMLTEWNGCPTEVLEKIGLK